jgi:exonuclease III
MNEKVNHGGVAILVRNDLEAYEVEDTRLANPKSEQVWCKVKLNGTNESLLVGCIYRPPNSLRETNLEINKHIKIASESVANKKYTGLLICGDFNHSDIEWSDLGGKCRDKSGRPSSLDFLETVNSNFLAQHALEPTFRKNTIDLILTEDPDRIYSVNTGAPLGESRENGIHNYLTWE